MTGIYKRTKVHKKISIQNLPEDTKKENNGMWKGSNAGYAPIHQWLVRNYGNAKQCDYCKILPEEYRTRKGLPSKKYPIHYALIKGKEHDHKRENYICLCLICHSEYDNKKIN